MLLRLRELDYGAPRIEQGLRWVPNVGFDRQDDALVLDPETNTSFTERPTQASGRDVLFPASPTLPAVSCP